MEEVPPDGENVSSDSSEESNSNEGTQRRRCSDSVCQAEEQGEDREELTGEPAEELAEEPAEELDGQPTVGPAEETAMGHLTLG